VLFNDAPEHFNQWVYGMEVPHYEFSYQLEDAGGGKAALQFALTQSGLSDRSS
jgi:hypothetical protein